jgi:hypothetical protein
MNLETLLSLTPSAIEDGPFPLQEVLEDSLFYPASGIDGTPIRYWLEDILSFVYVDLSYSKSTFEDAILAAPPYGYSILGMRNLSPQDLTPLGWKPTMPAGLDRESYLSALEMGEASENSAFGLWVVFERGSGLGDSHGPIRFSLVFLRSEAVATYQAIYVENYVCPRMLALIRPGVGFGGNFDSFEEVLLRVMKSNPAGMPRWLLQWHSVQNSAEVPDRPWCADYGKKIYGPLPKDSDRGFNVSVYPLIA